MAIRPMCLMLIIAQENKAGEYSMADLNRRQMIQRSFCGLAAGAFGTLTLDAKATPTPETPDVHDYESFLDKKGIPQVAPAGKWEPTFKDILGPFHVAGAPFRGKVTAPLAEGDPLVIRGRVWSFDTRKPVSNAVLDVWQADAHGKYDMKNRNNPPAWKDFKNRIRLVVDETGYYEYETIKPAAYGIGGGQSRPSHIHYMIQAPGYKKLITQLYFKGDPHIKTDSFGDKGAANSNLVIQTDKVKVKGGSYELGTFDIVLESTTTSF